MSISHHIWVPAGLRCDEDLSYHKYSSYAEMVAEHKGSRHQVFLAHGGPCLIDQQYFFEDPADAQWFWNEGYKERLYLVGDGPADFGYDRMILWLDAAEVASRGYEEATKQTVPASHPERRTD